MADLLDIASRLPTGTYILWVAWLAIGAGLVFYSGRQLRDSATAEPQRSGQSIDLQDSPGATVYQAGGDINLVDPQAIRDIQSVSLEVRLTGTLKDGAEIPPSEVEFISVGDAHAYLEGPAGRERLSFVSPVRFRLVDTDRVTVVNRFALTAGSRLEHGPVNALAAFQTMSVPIVTVAYGSSLSAMKLLEVTLSVNGEPIWYGAWQYDVAFETGPVFSVPLDELHRRLSGQ